MKGVPDFSVFVVKVIMMAYNDMQILSFGEGEP